jgi:NADH-quinone oxidoreductase subunit N
LYVLAGFARPRLDSEEAALKYFLLGAYAGGFVVYGIALVYGATGSTELAAIFQAVKAGSANLELMAVGAALILIGIGFKVSAVPFHAWTPDVYHGAPTAVTGFMSVAAKAGGFAALLRVFITAFPALALELTPILWILAALTMILGNLVAIAQTNLKRMLAYSSIAHAGYILMSVVVFGQAEIAAHATAAALFYLVAYAFTSFGAWAVVITLEKHTGEGGDSPASAGLELSDYIGMGRRYPALALAMTVFMLSFTGIPPTLGFVGKFYLFSAAIQAGQIGLAVIGVVTSLISAYYYLRIVVLMYMSEARSDTGAAPKADLWLKLTAFGSALAVIALGIFAGPLFDWAAKAVLK